jgi:hypothetical protein
MTESYVWGIAFLAMGVPQLGYGIVRPESELLFRVLSSQFFSFWF